MGSLFIGLLLLVQVALVIQPRLVWWVRAWSYRDPDANEPSDLYFLMVRIWAVVVAAALVWFWVTEVADGGSSDERAGTAAEATEPAEPPDSPSETPDPPDGDVLTTEDSAWGRIAYYGTPGANGERISIRVEPGECMPSAPFPSADIGDDTVTVTVDTGRGEPRCGADAQPRTLQFRLTEPLGDREVLDAAGRPIPTCTDDCS
ncbi:DUF6199 family natural product biosynthesis protein [Nocardiopsis coralliicola]